MRQRYLSRDGHIGQLYFQLFKLTGFLYGFIQMRSSGNIAVGINVHFGLCWFEFFFFHILQIGSKPSNFCHYWRISTLTGQPVYLVL